ncbi:unnamed protein product [Phytophthora lilii]|uniref:Unnamed protein product n=1 Tax=Phytophthora lilii TaxID=2077276 RepID=A0A9W6TYT8_9STRA|nr:unnamed protein product [Phytophthora lilii]
MERVPGSMDDSGFHRESQEGVQVKIEPREEASSDLGSTTMPLNEPRSADRQSPGRNSVDGYEGDLVTDPDLEEKPQPPPHVPSGTPADLVPQRDPLTKEEEDEDYAEEDQGSRVRWRRSEGVQDPVDRGRSGAGVPPEGATRVPDPRSSDADHEPSSDRRSKWTRDLPFGRIQQTARSQGLVQLIKEAGLVAGVFEPDNLFDLDLNVIQISTQDLFDRLQILVGGTPRIPDPEPSPQIGTTETRTASSHYASAAESVESGSESSTEPRRMSLGPSGVAMLGARSQITRPSRTRADPQKKAESSPDPAPVGASSGDSIGRLELYFRSAMSKLLREEGVTVANPTPDPATNDGSRDVEMESVGFSESDWEFDPDDLDFVPTARAAVESTAAGSAGSSLIQQFGSRRSLI